MEEISENFNSNSLINSNTINNNFINIRKNPLSFLRNKKSKKIDELSSVVLCINKDNLFSNFFDQNEEIN